MAGFVGAMSSMGMLALIGLLVAAFLRQIGCLSHANARILLKTAGMTLGVGCGYLLTALLLRQVAFGGADAASGLGSLFGGSYIKASFAALEGAESSGPLLPLSAVFSYIGRLLGTVMFHQNRTAGFLLAYLMTEASVLLMFFRARKIWYDEAAMDAAALLLCAPGGAFFFLPCGVPLGLLIVSLAFYFLGRRIPSYAIRYSQSLSAWALAVSVCLSAAVLCGMVSGRIG